MRFLACFFTGMVLSPFHVNLNWYRRRLEIEFCSVIKSKIILLLAYLYIFCRPGKQGPG